MLFLKQSNRTSPSDDNIKTYNLVFLKGLKSLLLLIPELHSSITKIIDLAPDLTKEKHDVVVDCEDDERNHSYCFEKLLTLFWSSDIVHRYVHSHRT